MKLKIEHITPYADKALKGYFLGKLDILTGIDFVYGSVSSLNNGSVLLKDFKPILLPLSDLEKEIELFNEINKGYMELIIDKTEKAGYYIKTYNIYIFNENLLALNDFFFKYHFDVYGLIEKGWAINYNDIYK